MSRLLNQERTMRKPEPSPAPEAPIETLNRLPEAVTPPAERPMTAPPRRHPFKRGVVFALVFGAPLLWYGWTQRPPDPWTPLLDGPISPAPLSPGIAALAVTPEAPIPVTAPVPPEPAPVPLRFAEERVAFAPTLPQDLAITVRTGLPWRPRAAAFPDDPTLTQAVDALSQLEEALQTAADLTAASL